MITDFFADIDTFRRYVQGVDGTADLDTLSPAYDIAEGNVIDVIGQETFNKIKAAAESKSVKHSMRTALAAYTMYKHLIFFSTSRNNTDQRLYKYQFEEIKEDYIQLFWSAMNAVLRFLDQNADTYPFPEWKNTRTYKDRQSLPVKSAEEFDWFYGIDRSEYFYSKVLYLLRTVMASDINPRIGKFSDYDETTDREFLDKVRRALCYKVMAEAVMKFDLTELPRSMRYDLTHEYTKEGSQMASREKIYNNLMADVKVWFADIESAVRYRKSAGDVVADNNDERDKFFLG